MVEAITYVPYTFWCASAVVFLIKKEKNCLWSFTAMLKRDKCAFIQLGKRLVIRVKTSERYADTKMKEHPAVDVRRQTPHPLN